MGGDVWSGLYEAEAFLRAQRLMAAAIGVPRGHEALLGELGEVSEWVFADDADTEQVAERFTRFTAMLQHGTQHLPKGWFDSGIMFGDYYFVEALGRYEKQVGSTAAFMSD